MTNTSNFITWNSGTAASCTAIQAILPLTVGLLFPTQIQLTVSVTENPRQPSEPGENPTTPPAIPQVVLRT